MNVTKCQKSLLIKKTIIVRTKVHGFFLKPIVVVLIILVSSLLTYFTGGLGYIFGMLMALTAFWAGYFKWSEFGIEKFDVVRTIIRSVILAIGIFLVIDLMIQPAVEQFFDPIDLSAFDGIRGNLLNYIFLIFFMWIVAAFGEEFLYRGFFMKRLAGIMGDTDRAWLFSAILISALFGLAHLYQGLSGVITTGLIGLIFSLIFYRNRKNLVLAMLTHGFYDVIGITLIYLDKDRYFIDLIRTAFG